jgi:hypothetical protein
LKFARIAGHSRKRRAAEPTRCRKDGVAAEEGAARLKHRLHGPGEGCSAGNIGKACGRRIDLNQIERAGLEGEVTGDCHKRARDARPRRERAAAGHGEAADPAGSRQKVGAAGKKDGVGARNAIAREAARDRTVIDDDPGANHAGTAGTVSATSAASAAVAARDRAGIVQGAARQDDTIAASPAGPTITSSATVASIAAGERASIAAGPAGPTISEQQATSATAASVAAIPARAATTDASPPVAPIAPIATGHCEGIVYASVHDRAVTARAATTAATASGASTAVPAVPAVAADRGARDRSSASVPRDTASTPTATTAAVAQVARASNAAISAANPNNQPCLATGTAGPGPPSRSIPTITTGAARHCS